MRWDEDGMSRCWPLVTCGMCSHLILVAAPAAPLSPEEYKLASHLDTVASCLDVMGMHDPASLLFRALLQDADADRHSISEVHQW